MGAATDLLNEDLRRLVVNAVFGASAWTCPRTQTLVLLVITSRVYGFDGFIKGVKVDDLSKGDLKSAEGRACAFRNCAC